MSPACILAMTLFAASRPGAAPETRSMADSLRSLQVILSSEFEAGNRVLKLQDGGKADSLARHATRNAFYEKLKDTTLARAFDRKAEFAAYWKRVQEEYGYAGLKGQLASHDVDKSRIPKAYLFDSSVVVYPGWIILRKAGR